MRYILSRFKKVYLPYVAYTVVYYLLFIPIGRVPPNPYPSLIKYIVTGTLSAQFYYVILVMQFYLLIPLWRWVVRRVPWYAGVPLSLFLTMLAAKGQLILDIFGLHFDYFERVFPTYLVFWVAGLYAGKHYAYVRETVTRSRGWTLSLAFMPIVYLFLVYLARVKGHWLYDFDFMKLFSDLGSIAVLLCLCVWIDGTRLERIKSLLIKIHTASFSVFLSHPLFLTLSTFCLQRAGMTRIGAIILFNFVICYTLPFLLHRLLARCRSLLCTPQKDKR